MVEMMNSDGVVLRNKDTIAVQRLLNEIQQDKMDNRIMRVVVDV